VIVARRKVKGARELGRMKEGGQEERVYRVVQAARGAIPETGALKRSRVIHKSSGYLNNLSTREPATKREALAPLLCGFPTLKPKHPSPP
jgi:hypothetical protein